MNSSSKEIQRLAEALKEWRSSHSAPSRLPEDLWSQAARLAAKNGVGPIARALKLDHAKLKRLAEKIGIAQQAGFLEASVCGASSLGRESSVDLSAGNGILGWSPASSQARRRFRSRGGHHTS